MPFFVAVHHQVRPGCREQRVETVRTDFAASPVSHPGRRFARLFEHPTDQTRLLAMEEWQSPTGFERHRRSPGYVEAIEGSGPAPRFDVLERLQYYRHMPHSPSALACTAISTAATLAVRGATLDQFAGRMAAEYSWLET